LLVEMYTTIKNNGTNEKNTILMMKIMKVWCYILHTYCRNKCCNRHIGLG
jgi:hypothetical protein